MLYLGVSEEHSAQLHILKALTRKFCLHPDLDLSVISEQCPFNYTGADFYALCSDALLNAMTRKAEELDVKIGKSLKTPSMFYVVAISLNIAILSTQLILTATTTPPCTSIHTL